MSRARVLVLMGGPDAERAVSIDSGHSIAAALAEAGWAVMPHVIDTVTADDVARLAAAEAIDAVFPALHGPWGEGGPLQRVLEDAGVTYVGSGPAAASLAMNKWRTKQQVTQAGVATPEAAVVEPGGPCPLGPPLVLKPVDDGSSVDLRICRTVDEIRAGRATLHPRRGPLLAERYVSGRELTVGLLDGTPLPIVEIVPAVEFYDYDAKYKRADTRYVVEPPLPDGVADACARGARVAYERLGCRDLARVDFMLDAGGPWFLELNTMPGFTTHSLLPMAAARGSMAMPALCGRLVDLALARSRRGRDALAPTPAAGRG